MATYRLPGYQPLRMQRQNYLVADDAIGGSVSLYEGITAYGNAAPLTLKMSPSNDELAGQTYVYRGGIDYTTTDTVIRDLWINSGFTVETL